MRKRNWTDEIVAQFAPGTLAEIASVLRPGETRINLVRMAVDREIARRRAYRRERAAKKQQENEQQPPQGKTAARRIERQRRALPWIREAGRVGLT
jgi:hypothetical protein